MKKVFICRNDNGQILALGHFESNMENEWRGAEEFLKRGPPKKAEDDEGPKRL